MLSPRDLKWHLDWDGGVIGAIRAGVTLSEIPRDLSGLWDEAEALFAELEAIERDIEYELDRLLEEADAQDKDTDL